MKTKQKTKNGSITYDPRNVWKKVYKLLKGLSIIFITLFAVLFNVSAQDWPMFQHDPQHTGYTNSSAPMEPNVLWSFDVSAAISFPPIVKDGMIFVMRSDGGLYALNGSTGRIIWTRTKWCSNELLSIDNEKILVAKKGGGLSALNISNGKLIWEFDTERYGCVATTIIDPIIFTWCNKLYALNGSDGKVVKDYGEVEYPTITNDIVIFINAYSYGVEIYVINMSTGKQIWKLNIRDETSLEHSLFLFPVITNGIIFLNYKNKLYAINETTGKLIWNYTTNDYLSSIESSPAVSDGMVFFCSEDERIYALNTSNGKLIWSYKTGGSISYPPAIASDVVFVGSDKLYALNKTTGKLIWSYNAHAYACTSPVIADGKVFIVIEYGKLYAFGSEPTQAS